MATEDAETAHQQDAKEPICTFASDVFLPSFPRSGRSPPPPTLPDRASLEPLLREGLFFVWHQWALAQFTKTEAASSGTPSSHHLRQLFQHAVLYEKRDLTAVGIQPLFPRRA